ncbi:hypothetical protein ACO34A_24110 (plasmid) [Rhizobium sp. ACO-34A]|nr:hypothetical protein [Rhizobium sp. ACO-34A]ATN36864.1 hypothetical protein ACO34A_24110 [Rhizobium sp. ACO-34A]
MSSREEKATRIDLGIATDIPFFSVASISFSADLAVAVTQDAKRRWGKLGYVIIASQLLWRARLFTAKLDHDGTLERFKTLQDPVGNERFYGGGITVHPDARTTDGTLDFTASTSITGGGSCICLQACAKAPKVKRPMFKPSQRKR